MLFWQQRAVCQKESITKIALTSLSLSEGVCTDCKRFPIPLNSAKQLVRDDARHLPAGSLAQNKWLKLRRSWVLALWVELPLNKNFSDVSGIQSIFVQVNELICEVGSTSLPLVHERNNGSYVMWDMNFNRTRVSAFPLHQLLHGNVYIIRPGIF